MEKLMNPLLLVLADGQPNIFQMRLHSSRYNKLLFKIIDFKQKYFAAYTFGLMDGIYLYALLE